MVEGGWVETVNRLHPRMAETMIKAQHFPSHDIITEHSMELITTQTVGAMLLAILLDSLLGEPRHWHPLAGFGRVTTWVERLARIPLPASGWPRQRIQGGGAWLALVGIPTGIVVIGMPGNEWNWLPETLLLYLAIGAKSLTQHGKAVLNAIRSEAWDKARQRVGYLVSRDTSELDPEGMAKATIESLLENGCDAIFGALFWFLLAGAPGAVAYRLINTLDAMWGYKTPIYLHFGWAAARADDVMNFIPARLTAITYAILGHTTVALHCWRQQASTWKSPNAGPVMASGAGALGVLLGGSACYHGVHTLRPPLGEGRRPSGNDIQLAIALLHRGILLWCGIILLLWGIGHA